ncbi:MAG TPA: hypothetical protein VFR78_15495 [Pyrinomonadaceae bacterium]|nr:hypothetical protein [Pyrinomonadaceae bacterium]
MRLKRSGSTRKPPDEWRRDRSAEFYAHSFIVKVWIEEENNKQGNPIWHGHITHVPGGEQRYLRSLSQIQSFVKPYLKSMGIKFGLRERIRRWLSFRNSK